MSNPIKKILWIFIIITSFFCCSCAHQQYHQKYQQEQLAYVAKAYRPAPFSAVVITGNANVEMTQSNSSAISFAGQKQYVDGISTNVINNTLYIDNKIPSSVVIKLQSIYVLRNLVITNHAYLSGNNLATKKLNIYTANEAGITLNGEFDIANIKQNSSGKMEIKWINSNNLKIAGNGNGPIYLAGTTDNLTAKLFGNSRLEARYLRAQQATIMATDSARADVLAIKTLNAYADRRSNILYYKRPQEFNRVSKNSGNVLLIEELR